MTKKSLMELRTKGFHKSKKGMIHLRCFLCGRKMSNMPRNDYDPPDAFLVEVPCENCSQGAKDTPEYYYDVNGKEIINEQG